MADDILELIKSRRTVQQFEPRFVSWEKISRIIDAARHAPSSGNLQNWKCILIMEPDQKQQVAQACYDQLEIAQAGALIVVCNEVDKVERYYGVRGERLYSIQNCAAAIQNMLLEAQSLGLGSRWIGGFDEEALKSQLGIPEDVRPQAIVAIGYAKEIPDKPPKYPLETVTYFRKWRSKILDPDKYMNNIGAIMARKVDTAKEQIAKVGEFIADKAKGTPSTQKVAEKPPTVP